MSFSRKFLIVELPKLRTNNCTIQTKPVERHPAGKDRNRKGYMFEEEEEKVFSGSSLAPVIPPSSINPLDSGITFKK